MTNKLNPVLLLAIAVLILSAVLLFRSPTDTLASVNRGNEYFASTTALTSGMDKLRVNEPVTLGSVIIASSSPNPIVIWNATSTNDVASTTFITFRANAPEGTYTFDTVLPRGLIVDGGDGSVVVNFRAQ